MIITMQSVALIMAHFTLASRSLIPEKAIYLRRQTSHLRKCYTDVTQSLPQESSPWARQFTHIALEMLGGDRKGATFGPNWKSHFHTNSP